MANNRLRDFLAPVEIMRRGVGKLNMYARDSRLFSKWRRYGNTYPPVERDGRRYWLYKPPDLKALFDQSCMVPWVCQPTSPISWFGRFLIMPLRLIFNNNCSGGLAAYFGVPLIFVDIAFVSHGFLSVAALIVLYMLGLSRLRQEWHKEKVALRESTERMRQWQDDLPRKIEDFRKEIVPELIGYQGTRIGKAVPQFHEVLLRSGIKSVLEAVPKDSPYRTENGVFAADIGVAIPNQLILLDIEIDEPQHFHDFEQWCKDRYRNNLFLSKGWAVVRFSEHAILTSPEECAKDVIDIIRELQVKHQCDIKKLFG